MAIPSVKTLSAVFGDRAKEARHVLEGKRSTMNYESVQRLVQQCHHQLSKLQRTLVALNEIAELHGVECVKDANGKVRFEYLNTGDTYAATLIYNNDTGTYQVTGMGDKVEALERRGVKLP